MYLCIFIIAFVQVIVFTVIGEEILDGGALKTCPRPKPPKNAIISHLSTHRTYSGSSNTFGYGVDEYHELDRVYFQCRDGYSQSDFSILYTTCGSNGKWFPDLNGEKKCLPNRKFDRCLSGLFMCKSDSICISDHLRCDCYSDCADGSDEIGCEYREHVLKAPFSGRDSSGIISSPGFPLQYPKRFSCTYKIQTLPGYHLELYFSEFDVPSKINGKCRDYVLIDGSYHEKTKSGLKRATGKRKCGNKTLRALFTNSSRIVVNISLGNMKKYARSYRGFVMSWKVRHKKYIERFISAKTQKFVDKVPPSDVSDNNSTLIGPIIVAAIIPVLLIVFICLRKQKMQQIYILCKQKNKKVKQRKERNQQVTNALLLTTENLEKFNSQSTTSDEKEHQESRTLFSKEDGQLLPPSGNMFCTISNGSFCKNISNSDNSNSRHNNSLERQGERKAVNISRTEDEPTVSTDSDHPRYVLSYDLLKKSNSSKQKKTNQSDTQRFNHLHKNNTHKNSIHNVNNSNNSKNKHQPQTICNISKSSKESKEIGTSSRSSKSTSHCTFCAHRKTLQKPKRLSPVGYECPEFGESTDVASGFGELHHFNEYKEQNSFPNDEKLFSLYTDKKENTKNNLSTLTSKGYLQPKDGLNKYIDNKKYVDHNGTENVQPRLYNLNKNLVILATNNNDSLDKVLYKTRGGSILCTH